MSKQLITILLALLLSAWDSSAQAGFSQVFHNSGPVAGATTTVSMTGITAGCAGVLFITMKSENRTVSSVTDSAGTTWTSIVVDQSNGIYGERLATWGAGNLAAGDHTLTITFDTGGQSGSMAAALEYCGVTTSPFDVGASTQASGVTGWTVGPTGTTAQADEYVVSAASSVPGSRPFTTPSGYTSQLALLSTQFVVVDKTVAATGTQSATWDVTGGNSGGEASIITLKAAAASAARTLTLMGVGQ